MGKENEAQDAHNKGQQDYSNSRDREINPIRDAIQSPYDPPEGQKDSYDINLQNLFRLQRFFMASMRRPRLVGLSQA
jgi:hypothetical protein